MCNVSSEENKRNINIKESNRTGWQRGGWQRKWGQKISRELISISSEVAGGNPPLLAMLAQIKS